MKNKAKLSMICGIAGSCLIVLGFVYDIILGFMYSKTDVAILPSCFILSFIISIVGIVLGLSAERSRSRLIGTILSSANLVIIALTPIIAVISIFVLWNMSTGGA